MNDENILPYRWKKGQSGNPKGRPKSTINTTLGKILSKRKIKALEEMPQSDIDKWEKMLLTMDMDSLKSLAQLTTAPSYPRSLAVAILFDTKNGNTKTLDKLRSRQYNDAPKRVELTGKDGAPLTTDLNARISVEDARDLLKALETDV